MRRFLAATALCAIVAGCGTAPQLAATVTHALPAETVATIADLCRKGEPLIRLAGAMPISASAKDITGFVANYCNPMLAGSVPSTTDSNTVNWLTQNLGTLRVLLGR